MSDGEPEKKDCVERLGRTCGELARSLQKSWEDQIGLGREIEKWRGKGGVGFEEIGKKRRVMMKEMKRQKLQEWQKQLLQLWLLRQTLRMPFLPNYNPSIGSIWVMHQKKVMHWNMS